tara:strand:- start:343 stop:978 length:636 start_codon:yes stop_codon:yes gene_type:complete
MKSYYQIIFLLFVNLILFSVIYPNSKSIAICVEIEGHVLREGHVRKGHLRQGDSIYDGDKIIVNDGGYLSFMFIKDKTIVDAYENSIIKVVDGANSTEIKSNVALFGGKVIIQMEEINNGKFILDAPSSTVIASNAHFIAEFKNDVVFNHLSYAIFTSLLGKIEIENLISENFINIKRGETVISTLEGKFLPLDTFRNQKFIEQTLREVTN